MTNQDTLQKVIEIIGETFDFDVKGLNADSVADDVDGWDSVSHAMLVMNLEEAFDVELDIERSMAAQTLDELAQMVDAQVSR